RIAALARAHDLLSAGRWEGLDVRHVVEKEMAPHRHQPPQMAADGPAVVLSSAAGQSLALVLHELGTNAAKYGALSVPNGRVDVSWEMRHNGGRHLLLEWRESGGPKTNAPTSRGFGTTLIEQTLKTCGGSASLRYGTAGVTC